MNLKQIKEQIAALLNVDSVNAKSLFELANCNSVVLAAIQSVEPSQFNLRTTETWQAILNKLKGEGVNESLSSECGGVTGNEVNSSVNLAEIQPTLEVKEVKLTPNQIQQRFESADIYCEKVGSKYRVQFNTSSDNPSKVYEYSVNKYALIDLAEKFKLVTKEEVKAYRNKDERCYKVSEQMSLEVLTQEKTLNPNMSPEKLLWHCVDKYGWDANDVFEVVYSLFEANNESKAEMSSGEDTVVINTPTTLSDNNNTVNDINLTSSTNVTTETSDNKFKGIPIEHYSTHSEYCDHLEVTYSQKRLEDNQVMIVNHDSYGYFFYTRTNKTNQKFNNLVEAVEIAKNYLATESEQIKQAIEANIPHQYAAVLGGQQLRT